MMPMESGRSEEFMFTCLFFVIFLGCFCSGSDTISTGQSLFPNQTIISNGGKFELGFFTPSNSISSYVGIWYKNIPARTVVWVANRNNPIRFPFNSSRLQMSNGSLYIIANSEIIWGIGASSYATEAVLLDTGNFILRDALSIIIWQSFHYPTDTWLPGGIIGFSDGEARLVSWRNPNDPGLGNYSLEMEPNGGSELFIKNNGSKKLWRSGALQGGTFASLSFNNNLYNFSYVSRDNSTYLTYNVYNEPMIVRIVMDYVGVMKLFIWSDSSQDWGLYIYQPSDSCKTYAMCGPNAICDIVRAPACSCLDGFVPRLKQDWDRFDFSSGCGRMKPLECANKKTVFLKALNIRLPANPESLGVTRNGVCEFVCSGNCSCVAYAVDSQGGCLLFTGDLLDLESLEDNSSAGDLYIRTDSVEHRRRGKKNVLLVALVVSTVAAIFIACLFVCYRRRKLKNKERRVAYQNLLLLDLNSITPAYNKRTSVSNCNGEEIDSDHELPVFSFSSIVASTNNFSSTNKLGEGGFGPVYKGELSNGKFVAVKRLSKRSGQGLEEFRNETELIAKLQHRNLVGILGCCIEKDEKILVYEYMHNKSLDFFLFDPTRKAQLDWRKRVHIIEGIAQGLLYLHHYSRLRIIHRDLKSSNILLDEEMNPKISDFGMARIFGGNDSQGNTKRIVGTYGYMSPEYAMEGRFSIKSDVFAFGVLMLETVSGKKNTGFYGSDYLSLLGYAWSMWKNGSTLELIDSTLEIPSTSSSIALRYIQIGLLCIQEDPAKRPNMSEIVAMLNNVETTIASPEHPAFTMATTLARRSPTKQKLDVCSVNGLTVSDVKAR